MSLRKRPSKVGSEGVDEKGHSNEERQGALAQQLRASGGD